MGRLRTITRRSFLVGSVAIGGAVAFGTYRAFAPSENPNEENLASGSATFNPWVVIDSDKITLIATHADKGQGVQSAQAALIAEELDVELDQVEISFGVPSAAYANGGMGDAMAGIPLYEYNASVERTRGFVNGALRAVLPMMATGGSSAMPDVFDKLRNAGATARETLKLAASQVSGVPVDQLKTAKGAVILPDGSELSYTSLAGTAAEIEPVRFVELRQPSEWRILGKSHGRTDMLPKCTGTLEYGIDFEIENMVHATVKTNPNKGAAMKSFDAAEARQMRGIQDVFEITNGVAVIANNTWRAIKAANTISFEWEKPNYPLEQAEHWAVLEEAIGKEEHLNAEAREVGDVETAEGTEVKGDYRSPYVAHAPLEPLTATILVTDDRVDIWTGHQVQQMVETVVAEISGIDVEDVHLHNMFIGGSFGHRLEFDYIRQAAEIATKLKGTPVKLTYSREEDFAQDFPRHITIGRGIGKHKDGKVVSMNVDICGASVMASQMGRMGMNLPMPDTQLHEGAWDYPMLNLNNNRVRSFRVNNLAPTSSWRSVGAAPNVFIYDTMLDETIHAAGADPMLERIRLMGHGQSVKVLETAAEMCSWNGHKVGPNTGRGVAYGFSFGVPVATVVQVTNTPAGIKLDEVWVAADVGVVIDPNNLDNLATGGTVFGLGHAINCEITYADGVAQQENYYDHEAMRIWQCPPIHFKALENMEKVRGFGEPPVPPAAPALGNAIFAATGQRLREMPFNKFVDFV